MAKTNYEFNEKLSFLTEWLDPNTSYVKKFIFNFYPSDNTIDMFDTDLNKMFLKRTVRNRLNINDLYIGNSLRIFGRQIVIIDYGDCYTKRIVGKAKELTLALLKPDVVDKLGEIIIQIQKRHFFIMKLTMTLLTRKQALDLFQHKRGDPALETVIESIVRGPCVALELMGQNCLSRWKEAMGPVDPHEARKTAPDSLIALFGGSAMNGFYGSESAGDAIKELDYFFPQDPNRSAPDSTVQMVNTTCCVVKPHAIHEGKLGHIISFITNSGFKISAAKMAHINTSNADDFLEIYKGVVSNYYDLSMSFLDGPCVFLEISGKNNNMNVHHTFRDLVGPSNTDTARNIRPKSLRAIFGSDGYRNAVHCTDLPEDTELELEYLFKILN